MQLKTLRSTTVAPSGDAASPAPVRRRTRREPALPPDRRRLTGYAGLVAYTGGALPAGTLRRLVNTDRIPYIRTGPRSVAFDLDAIDRWLKERERGARPEAA